MSVIDTRIKEIEGRLKDLPDQTAALIAASIQEIFANHREDVERLTDAQFQILLARLLTQKLIVPDLDENDSAELYALQAGMLARQAEALNLMAQQQLRKNDAFMRVYEGSARALHTLALSVGALGVKAILGG